MPGGLVGLFLWHHCVSRTGHTPAPWTGLLAVGVPRGACPLCSLVHQLLPGRAGAAGDEREHGHLTLGAPPARDSVGFFLPSVAPGPSM